MKKKLYFIWYWLMSANFRWHYDLQAHEKIARQMYNAIQDNARLSVTLPTSKE